MHRKMAFKIHMFKKYITPSVTVFFFWILCSEGQVTKTEVLFKQVGLEKCESLFVCFSFVVVVVVVRSICLQKLHTAILWQKFETKLVTSPSLSIVLPMVWCPVDRVTVEFWSTLGLKGLEAGNWVKLNHHTGSAVLFHRQANPTKMKMQWDMPKCEIKWLCQKQSWNNSSIDSQSPPPPSP